jgi:DHA1 family tetracycline resistance protein-like MFS transporter
MRPLLLIVLIVLVDLMGFTIVMPLLPRYADQYGFSRAQIGLLLAAFPLCQLVAGPILGRLSDRYGRRPVLVASQFGTALSFVLLALARDYPTMLLARALDGASGGNFLVAQAYVADVTPPEHRARSMGLIGAAFGLGFVLGPLLGGLMLDLPVSPDWQLRVPFLVAAGFSTIAWLLVLAFLPESTDAAHRQGARTLSWRGVADAVRLPRVGRLVAVGAMVTLAFAALEGTFSLYLKEQLGWGARRAAYGFAMLGLVGVFVQGGLLRRLVPRYGEPKLILVGMALLAAGLAGLAMVTGPWGLVLAATVVGTGYGLVSPSVAGLLSRLTPAAEQGAIFGVLASAQTLARTVNYLAANDLQGRFGPTAPYWEGAAVALAGLALAAVTLRGLRGTEAPHAPEAAVAATGEAPSTVG